MNISPREKALLLIFFYILLIGGLLHFVYFPVSYELAEAKQENHRLEKEVERFKQAEENQGEDSVNWQLARTEYKDLESRIPQEPGLVDLIALLEKIAIESNLSLRVFSFDSGETDKDFTPGVYAGLSQALQQKSSSNNSEQDKVGEKSTGLSQLTLTIEAKGSYYSLLDFLDRIRQTPRLITIEYCSLKAANSSTQEKVRHKSDVNDFQIYLKIQSYYNVKP